MLSKMDAGKADNNELIESMLFPGMITKDSPNGFLLLSWIIYHLQRLKKQSGAERLALLWIMQMWKVFREIIVVSSARISIPDNTNFKLRFAKTAAIKVYLMLFIANWFQFSHVIGLNFLFTDHATTTSLSVVDELWPRWYFNKWRQINWWGC